MSSSQTYDAIVVGSGPNGLSAAIRLALEGLSVKIYEASDTIGGGMRTKELIRSGYFHDVCSAIHPLAASSPFFKQLPLGDYGLEWIYPEFPVAHPMDDGNAIILHESMAATEFELGTDGATYRSVIEPIVENWDTLTKDFLGPLRFPKHPIDLARFGLNAFQPAQLFQRKFSQERAKALFAGLAAHSILPLDSIATSAIGLVLGGAGHAVGWPLPKGGSQSIAEALGDYFTSLGGEIETGVEVTTIEQLPDAKAYLFDITPRQLIQIAGDRLPSAYVQKLRNFKYGSGVFKIDYILNEPVPWNDSRCNRAGTVHLGGSFDEIAASEKEISQGQHSENPYVLIAQQSLFDEARTPDSKHTLWAYCHVPNGSTLDMTRQIETQIERFAPGFRDIIEARHTMNTDQFVEYNANYIDGDINGGRQDITQLFSRPHSITNPYATPTRGIYLCSSSTPPGGGVHGMCGFHAANSVLKREFNLSKSDRQFKG